MLTNLNTLIGYKIHATDGDLGKVDDFYFDDTRWVIRYMVVDTGSWLSDRKVLISPSAMGVPSRGTQTFTVNLTREKVKNSPDIDTQKPVYRQHEIELLSYYQWPLYWQGDFFNQGIYGMPPAYPPIIEKQAETETEGGDPHLRSMQQITGYDIQALDDGIGHVDDMVVDQDSWAVHFLVIKMRNWLPSKKVLISPQSVNEINWLQQTVFVDLSSDAIKNSQEYDPSRPLSPGYQDKFHPGLK